MTKRIRESNMELLRIVSMYMIVFIHANMYGNRFYGGTYSTILTGAINGICNIGVTCFVLISGYYGMSFKLKKFVKMECMMITYSLLELSVLYVVFPEQMQGGALLEAFVKSLLPFISRKYWFYSCYICLYIFSGYIDKFIEKMEKKEFRRFLALLLLLFSLFPTLFYFEIMVDNGKGLVQMFMIYLIGRYIRKYCDYSIPRGKALGAFCILWLINGISHEVPIQIGEVYHHFCKDNSITNILMAVILFFLFKEIKIRSEGVNRLAAGLFAVFALNNSLVQVTASLLRDNEWKWAGGMVGFLALAGIVGAILIVCVIIGEIRELIFHRIDEKLGNWSEKICARFYFI